LITHHIERSIFSSSGTLPKPSRSPLIGTGPARRPSILNIYPPLNFCFCLSESFTYLHRDSSTRQLNFASVEVTLGLSPRVLEDFAFPSKFTEIIKVWTTLRTQIGECAQLTQLTPLCLLIHVRAIFPPLLFLRRPIEKHRVLLLFTVRDWCALTALGQASR
jgi:hypothetical protein